MAVKNLISNDIKNYFNEKFKKADASKWSEMESSSELEEWKRKNFIFNFFDNLLMFIVWKNFSILCSSLRRENEIMVVRRTWRIIYIKLSYKHRKLSKMMVEMPLRRLVGNLVKISGSCVKILWEINFENFLQFCYIFTGYFDCGCIRFFKIFKLQSKIILSRGGNL